MLLLFGSCQLCLSWDCRMERRAWCIIQSISDRVMSWYKRREEPFQVHRGEASLETLGAWWGGGSGAGYQRVVSTPPPLHPSSSSSPPSSFSSSSPSSSSSSPCRDTVESLLPPVLQKRQDETSQVYQSRNPRRNGTCSTSNQRATLTCSSVTLLTPII